MHAPKEKVDIAIAAVSAGAAIMIHGDKTKATKLAREIASKTNTIVVSPTEPRRFGIKFPVVTVDDGYGRGPFLNHFIHIYPWR